MARVKRGNVARKRRKGILKLAKGFRASSSKLFRPAHQAILRALPHQTEDRRNRKRDFRGLWIMRMNAGLRENGISYSQFVSKMAKKKVGLNRKVLSELAIRFPKTFTKIVDAVRS